MGFSEKDPRIGESESQAKLPRKNDDDEEQVIRNSKMFLSIWPMTNTRSLLIYTALDVMHLVNDKYFALPQAEGALEKLEFLEMGPAPSVFSDEQLEGVTPDMTLNSGRRKFRR